MSAKLFKILVTHPEVPLPAINFLRQNNAEVTICESVPPSRSEILEKSKGVNAIFWACHEKLNAEALDAAGDQLKVISTMSAGIDYVDIPEVQRRGIPLGHTPNVLSEAVADIAVGLMLAAARRFQEGRQKIETSTWENYHLQWLLGQEIRDSTVGYLGFGGIGKAIAKRLRGFDIGRTIYCTRNKLPNESEYSATHVQFEQLLAESDFIIVACPLTAETKEIFNAKAFGQMKSNCVFVNIARGQVVDQTALYNALKNNQIFAAGLDVMTPEPLPASDPLLTLPNCVTVPHIGSATLRTRTHMAMVAAENVIKGLRGEKMTSPAY